MNSEPTHGKLPLPDAIFDLGLRPDVFRCFVLFFNRCWTSDRSAIWGTKKTMSDAVGLSRTTVYRALHFAVESGFLRRPTYMKRVSPGRIHTEEPLTCTLVTEEKEKEEKDRSFTLIPREWIFPGVSPFLSSAYEFRLLVEYARHPDWWMTNKQLAKACLMSERQVIASRRHLIDCEYLKPYILDLNHIRRYIPDTSTAADLLAAAIPAKVRN